MELQTDINGRMRAILVDWLVEAWLVAAYGPSGGPTGIGGFFGDPSVYRSPSGTWRFFVGVLGL